MEKSVWIMNWLLEQMDAMIALARLVREDPQLVAALERICGLVTAGLENGAKILTIGNGGSTTDAMHLAEELVGRYRANRRPLPALCLATDGSALTCIANDYGFDEIFARQVEALAAPGDILVAFSTSGASANIVQALAAARKKGCQTVGLLGRDGGPALALCDAALVIPHAESARIQEIHTLALHLICEAVERRFAPNQQ